MYFIFFHPYTIHSLCAQQHLQLFANVQWFWWHCNIQVFAFTQKGSYTNNQRTWSTVSAMMESSCWGGTMLCHVIIDNHKNGDYKMLLISSLILEAFVKASSCLQCSTKYKPTFQQTCKNIQMKPVRRMGAKPWCCHSTFPCRMVSCEILQMINFAFYRHL